VTGHTALRRARVAVVQDAPVVFDRDATLDRVDQLTLEAAGGGAQLVL
jgi:nitrilase